MNLSITWSRFQLLIKEKFITNAMKLVELQSILKTATMRTFFLFLLSIIFSMILFSCSKSGALTGTYSASTGITSLSSSSGSGSSSSSGSGGNTPAGVLTAGEWNDLENWDFLLNLFNSNDTFKNYQSRWGFYCNTKWLFTITDANQKPVENAIITVTENGATLYISRTNKFGTAHLIPSIFSNQSSASYSYSISYNGKNYTTGILTTANKNINYTLPQSAIVLNNVDLMFVIDATGSMGDELGYLKNELYNVLNRADSAITNRNVRYSCVFYRDLTDSFITKPIAFTSNKTDIVNFVKAQSAAAGGDYPEAVDEALKTALEQSWSSNAHAKLMFLILDAPPHDDKLELVRSKVKEAAERGITIIPIAASGTDKPTEFLLRFMAIATNGTYTFLTDDSGVGNSHVTASVGSFKVEFLNNLIVRLISKYGGN